MKNMKKLSLVFILFFVIAACLVSCSDSNELTVTFSVDGETYKTVSIKDGSGIKLPEAPQKEGYEFAGWYYDADFTRPFSEASVSDNPIDEPLTVYAKWKAIKYTASFYAEGKLIGTATFTLNDKTIKRMPKVPEKDGYVGGWESYKLIASDIEIEAVYSKSFTVKIYADNDDIISFNGETTQVITADNPTFSPVQIEVKTGFEVDYYEIDGVKYNSLTIDWKNVNSNENIYVYSRCLSELPVVHIDTNGAGISGSEEYTLMTFDLTNCDDQLKDISGGIRLRGNSTKHLPKQPYRIKFDKKQSLFGLDKAKSWVLLADYLDPSCLHNHAAFSLAKSMPGFAFVPTPHKVNVYINGEFQGLYTLCEQIQENEGRMNIEMPEITTAMKDIKDYNFHICLDYNAKFDTSFTENVHYIKIEGYGNQYFNEMYFELKYPEKEMFPSEAQFNDFIAQLKDYVYEILEAFDTKDEDKLRKEVNIYSLIDYVIIDEIMGQEDHDDWMKSLNIYYTAASSDPEENCKLNFGPIWDYDWVLHTPWTGTPNEYYEVTDKIEANTPFFNVALEIDSFYAILCQRFETYAKPALEEYIANYGTLTNSLKQSLLHNANVWYTNYSSTMTNENVTFLKKFLEYRLEILSEAWIN